MRILGLDVCYYGKKYISCAALVDTENTGVIESKTAEGKVSYPYVPGKLAKRELEPMLRAARKIKSKVDVVMVDGNGVLHPKGRGLACEIGENIRKPTIGVAKSLLLGRVLFGRVIHKGRIIGRKLKKDRKPVYVSVGYKISLGKACEIVKRCMKFRIPEPIRAAHIGCKKITTGQKVPQ